MKKLFIVAMALGMLASCAQDEVLDLNQEAIGFSGAHINNSTRSIDLPASHTTANLQTFNVYGAVEGVTTAWVNIFNGVEVTKNKKADSDIGVQNTTWWYSASNLQYWIAGKDYKFAAVVDGTVSATDAAGMPTEITVDASEQKDVLYATNNVTDWTSTDGSNVAFDFAHIMSKVKFTAEVDAMASAYAYTVEGITINGVPQEATYTIGGTWAATSTYDVAFGHIAGPDATADNLSLLLNGTSAESYYERLMVPGEVNSISFTVNLWKKKDSGTDYDHISTETKTLTVGDGLTSAINLAGGSAYNFVIELGAPGTPITFSANPIPDWTPAGDVDVK
ncbi:MAG: fimbrillin family protein [Alistipes sp.]|nr:fimbrillin family protein [Alistipes sp.]